MGQFDFKYRMLRDMRIDNEEVAKRERFGFGANWTRFLKSLNDDRICMAQNSLKQMLEVDDLSGKTFLDVGSGSGLFSLVARRLSATAHSFDYDTQSVACTAELKRRYFPDDSRWIVEQGSVLDSEYLQHLGQYDVVYSWRVLHHTGSMWQALGNVAPLVSRTGRLFIAIYNDQGRKSHRWAWVKRNYNERPWSRPFLLTLGLMRAWGISILLDFQNLRPFASWRQYHRDRGMSPWWDVVDWIGGWPFEVATPDAIFKFYRDRGFVLRNLITHQGYGCNEFVFLRKWSL